jgi:PAS domain S-box-containing protein
MMQHILVVDDEENIRYTFATFLGDEGHTVSVASSLKECCLLLDQSKFDLIFLDIMLGGDSGIDVLRHCRKEQPSCPVIMITGSPEVETATDALRLGAFDYIPKPIRHEALLRLTQRALEHKRLLDQKRAYEARLRAIFQSVKEGLVTVDGELVITELNEAAQVMFGCGNEVVGLELSTLLPNSSACVDLVRNTLHTTVPTDIFRVEMCLQGGVPHVMSLTTAPLLDEMEQILGVVMTLRDETRLDFLERDRSERQRFDKLIGNSAKMQEVYRLIEVLADVDTTVLITGESGTGKELVAESLHLRSPRRNSSLVRINCAALPETLLESELFGHVKGSFTGATQDKIGRFQRADGGTILLDEIADISPALQVRLLRVLQQREIEKVGGSGPIPVDIRIVAATHRNLLEKVRAGEFREDLYYRLKVVEIRLPPLRSRREDIPQLIEHFIDMYNKRFQRQITGVTAAVMDILTQHDWPGNVRELEHVIEHAFVLCRDPLIGERHLPQELGSRDVPATDDNLSADFGRQELIDSLAAVGGNKSQAAKRLGISRRTIYRKMEEFGLDSNGDD